MFTVQFTDDDGSFRICWKCLELGNYSKEIVSVKDKMSKVLNVTKTSF